MTQSPPGPFKDILGVDFPPERLEQSLGAFRPIRDEIRRQRRLDLSGLHPAVVFEPTAACRREPGQ